VRAGPAQQRMIRAQSNARPLDSTAQHTGAARLQRTPSWQTKFEGPAVDEDEIKRSLNALADQRLKRRSSWAAKFESPEVNLIDVLAQDVRPPSDEMEMALLSS